MEISRNTGPQLPSSIAWTMGVAIVLFFITGIAALIGWVANSLGQGRGGGISGIPVPQREKAQLNAAAPPLASSRRADSEAAFRAGLNSSPQRAELSAGARSEKRSQAHKVSLAPGDTALAHAQCTTCGIVESVRKIEAKGEGKDKGYGLGVVGSVPGAVIAGNEIKKWVKPNSYYEVTIRLDDRSARVVRVMSAPGWQRGDYVKIADGSIHPN